MTIKPGDKLPNATFQQKTGDGVQAVTVEQLFSGRKVVLFSVPGAFTPTCSMNHLPGYIAAAEEIKAKGADMIAVVSVNDPHVMKAWEKHSGANGKVVFLADGNGDFADAVGLSVDLSKSNMGKRMRRSSMIVDNGVVKTLNVEDKPGVNVSGADVILTQL
jgi:glutaredoxin/glutathione-dependent peroxiredoxin